MNNTDLWARRAVQSLVRRSAIAALADMRRTVELLRRMVR
jgi:hypothetical protein